MSQMVNILTSESNMATWILVGFILMTAMADGPIRENRSYETRAVLGAGICELQ